MRTHFFLNANLGLLIPCVFADLIKRPCLRCSLTRQFAQVCQRNGATLETQTQNTNFPLHYSLCITFASFVKSLVCLPTGAHQCKYLPALVTLIKSFAFALETRGGVLLCPRVCRGWRSQPGPGLRRVCWAARQVCRPVSLFIRSIGFAWRQLHISSCQHGLGAHMGSTGAPVLWLSNQTALHERLRSLLKALQEAMEATVSKPIVNKTWLKPAPSQKARKWAQIPPRGNALHTKFRPV